MRCTHLSYISDRCFYLMNDNSQSEQSNVTTISVGMILSPESFFFIFELFVGCFLGVHAGGGGSTRYVNTASYSGPIRSNTSIYGPLLRHILKDYSPLALPICSGNDPLHMMLDLWLYQLFDLDEPKQELTLEVWIDLNWKDCSIEWDPAKYSDIKEIVLPSSEVWFPDIFTYQGLHANYEEGLFVFKESKVKITSDGVVQLGAQLLLKTFCRINIAKFPYDEQICPITFSAWNKDLSVFNMTKKPRHGSNNGHTFSSASNGEWSVMGLSASDSYQTFHVGSEEGITERFSEVTFTLHLKRKPRFMLVYLVFPCMLLLYVAGITFILPVSSTEKINLVSTVLLSMIVFLLIVASYVPQSSDSVPIIGKFYLCSISLVGLAMFLTTIVINISLKETRIAMPPLLQRLLYSNLAHLLFFSLVKQPASHQRQNSEMLPALTIESHCRLKNRWEHLGLLLDRLFFLVYVALCLANTCYMTIVD